MKTINASLLQVGTKDRVKFPITELLIEGNIDPVNKIIVKRGIPYSLDSLQFEILDVPAETTATTTENTHQ